MKFPFIRFRVEGQSMLPTLQPESRVLLFCWGKISPGDIIVFYREGINMIKRAISKTASGRWIVRGDNCLLSAESGGFGEISEAEILGKLLCTY